jgi:hypothetical protein
VQKLADAAYLEGFPFPALLRVAPYCVPGGINTGEYLLHHAACERYACEVRLAPRPARQHPANPRPLLSLDAVYGRSTAEGMDEALGYASHSCP